MTIDANTLKISLQRVCAALQDAAPELNALDGRLGDGDLGATLRKCALNVSVEIPSMGDTLSDILKVAAMACAKASGSSFGTLLVQGLLVAAKDSVARSTLSASDLAAILHHAVGVMSTRGGAGLGDKTVLDPIDAVAHALSGA